MPWLTCHRNGARKTKQTLANVKAQALFDALTDNVEEEEVELISDTLRDVKTKA